METLQQRTYRIARQLEDARNELVKAQNIVKLHTQLVVALVEYKNIADEAFSAELAEKEGE